MIKKECNRIKKREVSKNNRCHGRSPGYRIPERHGCESKIKGDTLIAPGVGDDTRGLVMVVAVLRAIEAAQIKTQSDVLFIGSVGEEGLGDLRGVKHLFSKEGH